MYIFCNLDMALPLAIQKQMASQLGKAITFEINSGHCPHISMPEKVCEGIEHGIRVIRALRAVKK